jgi:Tfp pilus assembly protein PilN
MPELTEQQAHLSSLIQQRDRLSEDIEKLKTNATQTRDLYLKVLGAIEYLVQVGVTLPEPEVALEESAEETTEEVAAEG